MVWLPCMGFLLSENNYLLIIKALYSNGSFSFFSFFAQPRPQGPPREKLPRIFRRELLTRRALGTRLVKTPLFPLSML